MILVTRRRSWGSVAVALCLVVSSLVVATSHLAGASTTLPAGAAATQGCPYGGTLSGTTCSSSTPGTPTTIPGCPNGGTLDASGNCDVPATDEPTTINSNTSYYCPSGGSLSGSGTNSICTVTNAPYAATPTQNYTWGCPSGWSNFNSNTFQCSRVVTSITNKTTCNATGSDVWNGSQCIAYTNAVDNVPTTITYSCPTGGSLSGTTCQPAPSFYTPSSSTTFTYSCNSGGVYDATYSSCVIEPYSYPASQVAGPVGCAPNAIASGTNCVLSYAELWTVSEVVCGVTYSGIAAQESVAINQMTNSIPPSTGVCVVVGTTPPFSAAAAAYQSAYYANQGFACPYIYYSSISQNDAIALATAAATTLCDGQTVATSNEVTGSYVDPCTGLVYSATAQATEPGGGPAAAGTAAYNGALAVAATDAENAALAADPTCQAISPATYSSQPVAGEVPVTATLQRSGNGSDTVTYPVCNANGTMTSVTNSFTSTDPAATGSATVYSPNNANAIAAAQLQANLEAAAAAVTEAIIVATADATLAANNAVNVAAEGCLIDGQPTSTTTTTLPSGGGGGSTTTTIPSGGGTQSGGAVSTGAVAGGGTLDAVDCPTSTMCVAVGYNANFHSIWTVGTESGTAWSWTTEATIPSDSTGVGLLAAIACPTTTTCIATGGSAGGSTGLGVETIGTLSNGTWTWTPEADLAPDAKGGGVLFAINCPSTTECVAVGDDHAYHGVATSATLQNGAWVFAQERAITGVLNGIGRLLALSCPSTTECVAVGDGDDPGSGAFAIGTKVNGTWTWTSEKAINGDGTGQAILDGVACPTTGLCIAVGYDNALEGIESVGTLANGTWTWTTAAPVYIGAAPLSQLAGVTCSSVALCSTIGYNGLSEGQAGGLQVLAGVPGWTDQLTVTSPAVGGGRLLAIASTGIGQYVAVGYGTVGIVIGS